MSLNKPDWAYIGNMKHNYKVSLVRRLCWEDNMLI